ncbi:MAG: M3 family oligoendopeptidase, partial [Spirochaetales bacterium]|nr:M3 family oligoendopeptidase [Spirochaetales bacterium]
LSNIYDDFNTPQHVKDMDYLKSGTDILSQLLCEELVSISEKSSWLKKVIAISNHILGTYENLEAYAYTRYSTNTRDEAAVKGISIIEEASLPVKAISVALKNRLAEVVGDEIDTVLKTDSSLTEYSYVLKEMLDEQQHQMQPAEEALAADLGRSGGDAWSRLQESVSSTASTVWNDETGERKTVIELRALAYDGNREIREKAYRKELEIWKQYEIPMAFSINGVKGSTITLNQRRKYTNTLEHSILQSKITGKTLDSLISVMEESLPVFRDYLKLKAAALGIEKAAFYDIFAPISSDAHVWTFQEAKQFIIERFTTFHPGMGAFAEKAFSEAWIDAKPRDGKVGGAYCIGFPLQGESRVLCNFDGSLSSVSTVAHELGHAYHGYILRNEPPLLADYPMTLAETASIFAETIVFNGALEHADEVEKPVILETFLQESTQVIVDILSRFYFERELLFRRKSGDLLPDELCAMMLDAQKKTYGDGLDHEQLHPYMWAVKGHYYRTEFSYYNFPYAFGQLFGLGLYALHEEQGESFRETYDTILYRTSRNSAGDVTKYAGFDIEGPDFWRQGIQVISRFVDQFRNSLDQV